MKKVKRILEKKEILPFLKARRLLSQYKKAKNFLLSENVLQIKFKERKPKGSGIWSFRINRQFRALGIFDKNGNWILFSDAVC